MDPKSIDPFNDHNYPRRLMLMIAIGAVFALCLTWFMYQLIHSSQQRLDESERAYIMEFVRLKRNESSDQKQPRPKRPTQSEAPPTPSPADSMADQNAADTALAVTAMDALSNSSVRIGGPAFGGSDGEYLPIVKVAPIYPRAAFNGRIEGECIVLYTVTTSGTTRDIRVVEDRCVSRYFYRPSIDAASKFKYKPRVIDGEAVEVHDVGNRFVYTLGNKN